MLVWKGIKNEIVGKYLFDLDQTYAMWMMGNINIFHNGFGLAKSDDYFIEKLTL